MLVDPREILWRLSHQLEALLLHDGWQREAHIPFQEKLKDSANQAINDVVQESYSFLSHMTNESGIELVEPQVITSEKSEFVSDIHSKDLLKSSSNWQDLQQQIEQLGYQPLNVLKLNPKVMIILSYAGGGYESAQQYIHKWMDAIQLKEESIYVTCVMKAKRDQADIESFLEEIEIIKQEIALTQPRSILVCGRLAYESLFDDSASISRGRMKRHLYQDIPVIVTYDPQSVLQFPILRKDVWIDVQRLQKLVERGN
ncbi:uracil-DNA glycosylase family protein [Entomospira entomophila]|uniref:Uracil-DNA glycosylase-like domain-containing protein n=1 Tax=Entomospira entomophila TaxID=2719988 RepID=A0A968G801_9SPIO|nr:uracil-DNA glycosylase family protein [Entomospira entomophilus]NIZ40265.1 hypothetical protein [Entomospira entomophilus]WDI35824.1 uracil-DNA glycosylase family protein [Entomospira entomophilus]